MPAPRSSRNLVAAMLVMGLALLTYTGLRAGALSFTYDEAWTSYYVDDPIGETLSGATASANNHLLNTVLMKASRRLFGAGDLAYRLPNLAAHVLYLAAAAFLALRLAGGWWALAAFLLINLNPFMLDFFSLARGYGLSLGLGLAAVAALLAEAPAPSWRLRWAGFGLAALAVLASFPMLLTFIAMCGVAGLVSLQRLWSLPLGGGARLRRWLAEMSGPLLLGCLLLAVIQRPLRILRFKKELYFGGVEGFWPDTVGSLLRSSLYSADASTRTVAAGQVAVALALLAAVAAAVAQCRRGGGVLARSPLALALLLLLAVASGSILQHHLLGVRYLLERTALLLVPLFMVSLAGALGEALARPRTRRAATVATGLLVGILALHTARAANLTHCYSWRYDASTRQVMDELERRHAALADPQADLRLLMSWPFKMSVRYYIRLRHLDWLQEQVYDYVKDRQGADYYYILGESFEVGYEAPVDFIAARRGAAVRLFPVSGALLIPGGEAVP